MTSRAPSGRPFASGSHEQVVRSLGLAGREEELGEVPQRRGEVRLELDRLLEGLARFGLAPGAALAAQDDPFVVPRARCACRVRPAQVEAGGACPGGLAGTDVAQGLELGERFGGLQGVCGVGGSGGAQRRGGLAGSELAKDAGIVEGGKGQRREAAQRLGFGSCRRRQAGERQEGRKELAQSAVGGASRRDARGAHQPDALVAVPAGRRPGVRARPSFGPSVGPEETVVGSDHDGRSRAVGQGEQPAEKRVDLAKVALGNAPETREVVLRDCGLARRRERREDVADRIGPLEVDQSEVESGGAGEQ